MASRRARADVYAERVDRAVALLSGGSPATAVRALESGQVVWDRSTVWPILRNPAYRHEAAFGKTKTAERHSQATRTTRAHGERHGRRPARHDRPAEE